MAVVMLTVDRICDFTPREYAPITNALKIDTMQVQVYTIQVYYKCNYNINVTAPNNV